MSKVPNLILTKKMLNGFKLLNPEQIVSILNGWQEWNEGETPTFPDDMTKFVWCMCEPDFEEMAQKYNATCERNRMNGKKGGAPKKYQDEDIQGNPNNPVGSKKSEWVPVGASGSDSGLIIIGNSNSNNNSNSNRPKANLTLESDLPPNAKKLSNFIQTKSKPKTKSKSIIDILEESGDRFEDKLLELASDMFADFNANEDYLDEYLIKFNELELEEQIRCLETYRGYLNYQRGKGKSANLKYYMQDHKWNIEWLIKYA